MDKITDKCTGCRTCEKVCPKACISMREDSEGFLVPYIDNEKCVSCGLCKRRCPQNTQFEADYDKEVYAVRMKNGQALMSSSSGGAFYVVAQYVLDMGGVVFGAAYTDDFSIVHIKTENIEELKKLQGSKYVQSDTAESFVVCKKLLDSGRMVLYSGTPCQIAGLKQYLAKDYENLITIDLICHGVPSQKLFKKYISYLSDKYKEPITYYNFRTKENIGWGLEYKTKTKTKTKTKYISGGIDPYYCKFLQGSTYRMSCYECKYANKNRVGDITIGDYWGIEKYHPDFYSEKGVSVMIINSCKGKKAFMQFKNNMEYLESKWEWASAQNHNLVKPTDMPSERRYIYKEIDRFNEKQYFSKYFKVPFKKRIKAFIKKIVPRKVLVVLKRLR